MIVKEQNVRRTTEDVHNKGFCTLCCNFKQVSKSWANTAEPWDKAECQQASWWLTETRVHYSQQLAQVANKARKEAESDIPSFCQHRRHSANTCGYISSSIGVPSKAKYDF